MAWTLPRLLALPPGCLDHAGTNVGRTQAKRRTSCPWMNTSGRLRKDRSSASLDVHDSSANLRDSSARSPGVRPNVSAAPENFDTMRTLIRIPLLTSDPELRRQSTPG